MKKIIIVFLFIFSLLFKISFSMDTSNNTGSYTARRDISSEHLLYEYKAYDISYPGILEEIVSNNYPRMNKFFKINKLFFRTIINFFENIYNLRKKKDLIPFEYKNLAKISNFNISLDVECRALNYLEMHLREMRAICSEEEFFLIKHILEIIAVFYFGQNITIEDHLEAKTKENGKLYTIIKVSNVPVTPSFIDNDSD